MHQVAIAIVDLAWSQRRAGLRDLVPRGQNGDTRGTVNPNVRLAKGSKEPDL